MSDPGRSADIEATPSRPRPTGRGIRRRSRAVRTLVILVLLAALVTEGAPSAWRTYRVQPGDTLTAIAARYNTTVSRLVRVNRLPGNGNRIYAGDKLRVPRAKARARRASAAKYRGTQRRRTVIHVVRRGETLSHISARYGVSVRWIASSSRLRNIHRIEVGQRLKVRVPVRSSARPRRATRANSFAGRTYPDRVVARAARNRAALRHRAVPSRRQVRRMIVRTARAHRVDPNLALAIAYQESGFNQRAVSVANAIGVMQVIPSTGDFVSGVYGRRLNLLNARDNIIAGVVLLRVLRSQASLKIAVAGYYQGLAGVRRNGMYPDTKRYVANVLALRRNFARQ